MGWHEEVLKFIDGSGYCHYVWQHLVINARLYLLDVIYQMIYIVKAADLEEIVSLFFLPRGAQKGSWNTNIIYQVKNMR